MKKSPNFQLETALNIVFIPYPRYLRRRRKFCLDRRLRLAIFQGTNEEKGIDLRRVVPYTSNTLLFTKGLFTAGRILSL
jgi:hypothetical protein